MEHIGRCVVVLCWDYAGVLKEWYLLFDLYLITDSCIVQNFLKQLFSVMCCYVWYYFFLSFTSMVDCTKHNRNWYYTIFVVVKGGLIRY
jgi:hypothetical protein